MIPKDNLINYYRKTKTINMDNVLKIIKVALIKYYGNKCAQKINEIIDNLIIVYVAPNINQKELDRCLIATENNLYSAMQAVLDELKIEIAAKDLTDYTVIDEYIAKQAKDTSKEKIKKAKFEHAYYLFLQAKKINDTDVSVFLDTNVLGERTLDKVETKGRQINAKGSAFQRSKTIYLKGSQISLQALIHEINHLLQYEELALITDENESKFNGRVWIGGTAKELRGDLVNEMINDYSAKDISKIFLTLYEGDRTLLDTTVSSNYNDTDIVCNRVGEKIYTLLKTEIKENLINGNAEKIKNIINASNRYNYDDLKRLYRIIIDEMNNIGAQKYLETLTLEKKNEYQKIADAIYDSINESYLKYQEDKQELNAYVDQLVERGEARRVK